MSLSSAEFDALVARIGGQPALPGLASTIPAWGVNGDYAPGTGVMQMSGIYLPGGLTVTNIVAFSGATGVTTSTNFWMALYRNDLTLMAQSANDTTSTNWALNTKITKALTTPQVTTYGGLYFIAYMQTATTPNLVVCAKGNANNIVNNDSPIIAATSTTGLTTAAPATAAALVGQIARLYAYVT